MPMESAFLPYQYTNPGPPSRKESSRSSSMAIGQVARYRTHAAPHFERPECTSTWCESTNLVIRSHADRSDGHSPTPPLRLMAVLLSWDVPRPPPATTPPHRRWWRCWLADFL